MIEISTGNRPSSGKKVSPPARSQASQVVILGLSVGLLIWAILLVRARTNTVTGLDAVINASLTDIKTPIEGGISILRNTGDSTRQGETLFTVDNSRVSQLKIQEIQSRIAQYKSQLASTRTHLQQQLLLLDQLKVDRQNQIQLEAQENQEQYQQLENDLKGAKAKQHLAEITVQRTAMLTRAGALAQSSLDSAQADLEQSQANVLSVISHRDTYQTERNAVLKGLTLTKTRSNYDPGVRLQESLLQIGDTTATIQMLEQNIRSAFSELQQAEIDVARQKQIAIPSPISGILWRQLAHNAEYVGSGQSVEQLLNCKQRWVDTSVDERDLKLLHPGTPAKLELYGSDRVLHGWVRQIRSGMGRVTVGDEVAVPVPPNTPRTSQVRVELAFNIIPK